MVSFFDIEKLGELLKDFYEITKIRITVSDEKQEELASYPPFLPPYCSIIQGSQRGHMACLACDRHACEVSVKTRSTYTYQCHAGLTEAISPLYVGDVLIGYLMIGNVFTYPDHEEGWRVIKEKTGELGLDEKKLKEALMTALPTEESYVRSAAQILNAVASYTILERMATLKEDLLEVRLESYLDSHYTEKTDATAVSDYLGIGKTQLYELSNRLYGCGIAEKIRSMRMQKAKELLREQRDLPLAGVAERCGFNDYNYFITVFRREVGMTPARWRRKNWPVIK
ncbi:MAG: PocR ligand-binding domain-containing protein [Clostridia bacterium]|nr:PocR ligand-binding domain-containing protein [Clostridia bacterium]